MADLVTRMPEPQVQRQFELAAESFQPKRTSGPTTEVASDAPALLDAVQAGGQSLPDSERAFFEPRFDRDFSRVRVHANDSAASAAKAVNARAYTVGRDVVFGHGQYSPGTTEGRRLMAHELTHVLQQQGITPAKDPAMRRPGGHFERKANPATGVAQRTPAVRLQRFATKGEWGEKMAMLKETFVSREITLAQEKEFLDGLNEAMTGYVPSSRSGLVLPIEVYPGKDAVQDGHVYFDKDYRSKTTPAKTEAFCQQYGATQLGSVCDESPVSGATSGVFIRLGPHVVSDNEALTRELIAHEEYHMEVTHTGMTLSGPAEELLAETQGLREIFNLTRGDLIGRIKVWLQYYVAVNEESLREKALRGLWAHLTAYYDSANADLAGIAAALEGDVKAWIGEKLAESKRPIAETAIEKLASVVKQLDAATPTP